ncbi:hypothetical protein [Tenacibaculum ovolyticum]|uniref:hypothetical protein n=1 Tax=Tenacibaculum ovolyticum TaxID=104270 RepID=UPI0003FFE36C|nr:hypothetical protein [Tenacibaculum ovolyticum]
MARTIAEIQQEILVEKEKHSELSALTSTSKTAIWRLWVYVVSTAIWLHEKIVERNALLSRPHTLNWYKEQALGFLYGVGDDNVAKEALDLEWRDGYFQYPKLSEEKIKELSIIKHCAISERLFDEIEKKEGGEINSEDLSNIISEYYYNQVGVLTLKVAKEGPGGEKTFLTPQEKRAFRAYMNQIKDAGTQIRVVSNKGDIIFIELEVYVDPLVIYTEDETEADKQNVGKLLNNLAISPVEDAIHKYVSTLEFNGAFVPTYLIDKIQKVPGVALPLLRKITIKEEREDAEGNITYVNKGVVYDDADSKKETPFFVANAGYFNLKSDSLNIVYKPYNLQTNPNFNV